MAPAKLLLNLIAVSFFLSGCGYAMEEIGIFKTGNIKLPLNAMQQYSEESVSYDLLKRTSLKTCLECHIHRDGSIPLSTAELAYSMRENIMSEVTAGEMPPRDKGYQSLSSCEIKLLQVWFDAVSTNQAAPQVKVLAECNGSTTPNPQPSPSPGPNPEPTVPPTTPEPTPTPTPTPPPASIDYGTLELSFKNLKMAFFDQKCLRCHSATAKRTKDPIMDTIQDIKTNTGSDGIPNMELQVLKVSFIRSLFPA